MRSAGMISPARQLGFATDDHYKLLNERNFLCSWPCTIAAALRRSVRTGSFLRIQFSSGLTNRPSVTDQSFVVQLPSLHPVAGLSSRRAAAPLLLCPLKRNEA